MESAEKLDKKKKKEAEKALKKAKFEAKKMQSQVAKDAKSAPKVVRAAKEPAQAAVYEFTHPPGAKKDISKPLPNAYNPKYVEAAWYDWWEAEGFFKPEYNRDLSKPNPKGSFVMVIPPPNVTGSLHIGHGLTMSIEDCLTRWHRMKGETTLWNPGCDHAGIATQVVVEKKIQREQGLTRHQLGREKFVQEVWKWKNEKGDRIYYQLKHIGCSCDWSRAKFTMDDSMSIAVTEAFVRMYDMNLIYRANRLVNWSCTLRSAISDIEVEKKEVKGRKGFIVPGYDKPVDCGVLTSFAYPIKGSSERIVVATTRPETMLGDTAVAVHPLDERYKSLHGKFVDHPFFPDRKVVIVADEMVDREFGTGAVKITPAHDANDFEVGTRHQLEFITVFTHDGLINENGGKRFQGLPRFEARVKVVEALKELGLFVGEQEHDMVVPVCSRSKDIIEPLLQPQWYVRTENMANRALEAVDSGALQLIPSVHVRTWKQWLTNSRDWCISRQLWWGHQVPAYLVMVDGSPVADSSTGDAWVVGRNESEAIEKAKFKFPQFANKLTLKQDPDVLDTWFSSQLFPFSIFGWPQETQELKNFYPGVLLETGHDILFFWVARMVMCGLTLMNELPFKYVYLHAMVRDAHGQKMSKSKGNVIDPMDVVNGISLEELHKQLEDSNLDPKEVDRAKKCQKSDYPEGIPECGTDALRFALCSYTSQGRDVNLDVLRVQGYRFFCNKIWQAVKYVFMCLGDDYQRPPEVTPHRIGSSMDTWILSRLSYTVRTVETGMDSYDFPSATTACFNFWLYEFCDFYLEYSKIVLRSDDSSEEAKSMVQQVLVTCCDTALRLTHPFMPFITEELWQRLPKLPHGPTYSEPSLCVAEFPIIGEFHWLRNEQVEREVEQAISVIKAVRSIRGEYNLTAKQLTQAVLVTHDPDLIQLVNSQAASLIAPLASCSEVICSPEPPKLPSAVNTLSDKCAVHVILEGLVDPAKEIQKLSTKISQINKQIAQLKDQLTGKNSDKLPENVRQASEEKLSKLITEQAKLTESLHQLEALRGPREVTVSYCKQADLFELDLNRIKLGAKFLSWKLTIDESDLNTGWVVKTSDSSSLYSVPAVLTYFSDGDISPEVVQWCFMVETQLKPALGAWLSSANSKAIIPFSKLAAARESTINFMRLLNSHLSTRCYLSGDAMTIADVDVATLCLSAYLFLIPVDVWKSDLPNLLRYLDLIRNDTIFTDEFGPAFSYRPCEKERVFDHSCYVAGAQLNHK